MIRTLVLYYSKYGSTKNAAKIIAQINGPAMYCTVDEFKPEYKEFENIIIGSPLLQEKLEPSIIEFVGNNKDWLKDKAVSLFCTCLNKNGGLEQLRILENFMGIKTVSMKAIGGRLIIDQLDETDHELIKNFLETVKLPFEDMDFYNDEEIIQYAMKLKHLSEKNFVQLDHDKLKIAIDEFLSSHNTCTLATCHFDSVRSTPIEYNYYKGFLYLLTEGGEKFANLLLNKNVSISVYEDFDGMNNLKGMQITGQASLIEDDEEFNSLLEFKGLNIEFMKSMLVKMNMIKIIPDKIEFLNSKFKADGYNAKQIYNL
ncbi:flavodoxin domain-containing protein [Methanobacterium sp.]|uniref:flavodoxin domain-containing protein n=1 Tax=Methanobacterium sp. TaxID=2164 RepID=UPI003C72A9F0